MPANQNIDLSNSDIPQHIIDYIKSLESENTRLINENNELIGKKDGNLPDVDFNIINQKIPVMFHSIDRNGYLLTVSKFWLEKMEYEEHEVIGRKSVEFLTEESKSLALIKMPEFFSKGYIENVPYQFLSKHGKKIDVLLSAVSETDNNGNILKSLAIMIDITERKNAEQLLIENQRNLNIIFNNIDELQILWRIDNGNLILENINDKYINTANNYDINITKNNVIGVTIERLFDMLELNPVERRLTLQYYSNVMETKEKQEYVSELYFNGKAFYTEITLIPILDSTGKLTHIVFSSRDNTEKINTQRALQESEEKFRQLFDNAPLGYQSLDENGNFLIVNDTWCRVLGYEKDEIIGRNFADLLPQEFQEHFCKNFPKFKAMGYILGVEYEMIKKDGKTIIVTFDGKIGKDDDGNFKQTHCILDDITERKHAEEELAATKLKQKTILENSRDLAYELNLLTGSYDYFSPVSKQVIGFTPEDFFALGIDAITERFHPLDREQYKKHFDMTTINNAYLEPTIEYRWMHSDGTYHWFSDNRNLITDSNGKPKSIIGNVRDITKRKMAEMALEESQRFLNIVYENSEVAISVIKVLADGQYIYEGANPMHEKLVGISNNDLIGKTPKDLIPYTDQNSIDFLLNFYDRCCSEKHTIENEHYFTGRAAKGWWFSRLSPVSDSDGKIYKLIATGLKITERKEAEEALRKTEARQSAMIANITDVLAILDPQGMILYKSPNIEKLFGWKPEEMVGKHGWITVHPDDEERLYNAYNSILYDDNAKVTVEYKYLKKDGTYTMVKLTAVNLINNPDVRGILINYHDISARKKALIELQENIALLETIAWNIPNSYLSIVEKDMTIGFSSGQEFRKLNIDPGSFWGKSVRYVFGKHTEYVKSYYEKTFLGQGQSFELFFNQQHQLYNTVPLKSPDGSINRILVVVENITQRKKAEEELNKLTKLESIGLLAGGIAHNFKNILANISFLITLIKHKSGDINEYLDKMDSAVVQASALATKFQSFSTGGAPDIEVTRLQDVINDAIDIALSGSEIVCRFDPLPDIWNVKADAKQMNEVFMNLIINSKQAMPKGGRITIIMENINIDSDKESELNPGNYVKITVRDNGMGIEEDRLSRIFDPFYTDKVGGTGLGLSSVMFIVKKHFGKISVQSENNLWTEFNIFIPASTDEVTKKAEQMTKIEKGMGKKILYVDDDEELRENFSELCELLEYDVDTAENGKLALEKYKAAAQSGTPYTAAILDLTLQGSEMQGEDILRELKKIDPDVKAIVFSGHSDKPIVANYRDYGFYGKLDKPIRMDKLSKVLKNITSDF